MKIALAVGTRPEFIKTWSVIRAAKARPNVDFVLIHTGQHYDYEMSQIFFEDLVIEMPDYNLEVGSHANVVQTYKIMQAITPVLQQEQPDILLVQGDTNSCVGTAIAAVQLGIPVGHIEAGCRSFDRTMPEEINRIVIDAISSLLFAPSEMTYQNLLREGCDPARCVLSGNTAVDALEHGLELIRERGPPVDDEYAVATIHRAGNVDSHNRLAEIFRGLSEIPIKCIVPIHPRTKKRLCEFGLDSFLDDETIQIIEPMGYLTFLNLLRFARLVITDSGGIQEETALLRIPTLTIRENTEWPETIWAGYNILVPANADQIVRETENALHWDLQSRRTLYKGGAGERIVDAIIETYENGHLEFTPARMRVDGYPVLKLQSTADRSVQLQFSESGDMVIMGGKHFIVRAGRRLVHEGEHSQ